MRMVAQGEQLIEAYGRDQGMAHCQFSLQLNCVQPIARPHYVSTDIPHRPKVIGRRLGWPEDTNLDRVPDLINPLRSFSSGRQ